MADDHFIDTPPEGAAGWRGVWERNARYRTSGGVAGRLRAFVRRLLRQDEERQKNFNLVVLDLVDGLRNDLQAMRRDARADLESLQRDMSAMHVSIARDVEGARELVRIGAARGDALAAALDQKIESLAVRLRDVTTPLLTASTETSTQSDYLYRRLEDGLRGTDAEIRAAVAPYVALAREHQPVIDAGCGRGEFLVACRDAGIEARGFDTNERSVTDLKARGLDVGIDAIPHCFKSLADAAVGSILAMHVVEHLPVNDLFALFREAARVLRPGGLLMIETPNAESLLVSASEFWRDPTHLAPRHPAALTLLAREYGFSIENATAIHPFPEGTRITSRPDDPPALGRVIDAINERLFGPQDLMLVVRKR